MEFINITIKELKNYLVESGENFTEDGIYNVLLNSNNPNAFQLKEITFNDTLSELGEYWKVFDERFKNYDLNTYLERIKNILEYKKKYQS